jgi:hypothetical protein
MSRLESTVLPPPVLALLDGRDLDGKVGETILLLTTGERGWPHVAMLSAGEVLAVAEDRVRLALWTGTETGDNLRRGARATLAVVLAGGGHYIEIALSSERPIEVDGSVHDRFDCTVERVLSDEVGYARLMSGITFELPDRAGVVARWQATVERLRED